VEGEAKEIAFGDEVGEPVEVSGYVVRLLAGEEGKELLEGFGEDEGLGGGEGDCRGRSSVR
jgi:hypothetical protein